MLAIVGSIARVVEELSAQTLVEGPVGFQLRLVAHKQVVEVLYDIGLCKALGPQTEIIYRTFEVTELKLCGTTHHQLLIIHGQC